MAFARESRVLLLQTSKETSIDLMLDGLADISEELARASYQSFTPEISLKICSAETLIAMKTVAGRFKDLADIETIVIKQKVLDWEYIDNYLAQVSEYKDISGSIENLLKIKDQHFRP